MRHALFGLLLAVGIASTALAQADPSPPAAIPVPAIPGEQFLLPTGTGGASDTEQWNRVFGQVWVRNVSRPSLYRVPPKNGRDKGRAVIIVPGGGYSFVSIEPEGFWVAERLAAQGYTAFVLKYRPKATPIAPDAFIRKLMAEWEGYSDDVGIDHPPAVDDLGAAISLVHARAGEWGLDAGKLGVIGFSAGALSTIRLLEQHEEAALVDNIGLIYPPISEEMAVKSRPDLFMAIATDDFLLHRGTLDWVWDWHAQKASVEFHLYSGGSHGFGMRPQGTTSDLWIDQYLAWLDLR